MKHPLHFRTYSKGHDPVPNSKMIEEALQFIVGKDDVWAQYVAAYQDVYTKNLDPVLDYDTKEVQSLNHIDGQMMKMLEAAHPGILEKMATRGQFKKRLGQSAIEAMKQGLCGYEYCFNCS